MLYFLKVLERFRNKYRIQSARMRNWDYGSNALYFITICTAHKERYFGSVMNGEIFLTAIGEIVVNEWLKTPDIRPDMNIILDEFVLMPNHFHAIIFIGNNKFNDGLFHVENIHDCGRDAMHCVYTLNNNNAILQGDAMHGVSTKCTEINSFNQFGPQVKNLSSIIRGFKSVVTIHARKINPYFGWQPRFHDIIIHDNKSYQRIKNYIIENPKKWENDAYWK